MKIKQRIQLLLATLLMSFGLVANLNLNKAPEIKAEAVSIQPNTRFYLKVSNKWLEASAKFSIYFYSGTSDTFVGMSLDSATGPKVYTATSPSGTTYSNLIFVRHNPNVGGYSWSNCWNQTGDLTYDGTNNVFVMPEGVGNGGTNSDWQPPFITQNTALYFRANSTFMDGADRVSTYFFNEMQGSASNVWVNCTEVEAKVFKVTSPKCPNNMLPNKLIFVSMSVGTTGNDWSYKKSQTTNLSYIGDGKVLYDYSSTSWQTYTPLETIVTTPLSEGITSNKIRIWVDRGDHYNSLDYIYTLTVGTSFYLPSGHQKALEFSTDGLYFPYFDIDITTVLNKQVGLAVVDNFNKLHLEIPKTLFSTGDNSKLWKVNYNGGVWSYSKTAVVGKVYNTFIAKVLEGYLTCLSSVHNGYGAFNLFNTNFIPLDGTNWNMDGTLSEVTINDYNAQSDYTTGNRTRTVNAQDKYNALQSYYNAANPAPKTLNVNSNSQITTLVIIGLAGILTLAGYILLRKRYTY